MKELFVYSLSGIMSLIIFGYTVHMFIGGLVAEETEYRIIIAAMIIAGLAMIGLALKVVRERRKRGEIRG